MCRYCKDICHTFSLAIYLTQVYLGSDLLVCHRPFADLTDVTLADEDTNSILTDNANRAFQGNNVTMRVTQSDGQLWNQAMQVTLPDEQLLN